jgi:hypothetical protein
MHVPEQIESQHTPSTQYPLRHCDPAVQALPFAWSGLHVVEAASQ